MPRLPKGVASRGIRGVVGRAEMTYVGGKRWNTAVRSCAVEVGDGGKCAQTSYRGSGLREEKLVYPDRCGGGGGSVLEGCLVQCAGRKESQTRFGARELG